MPDRKRELTTRALQNLTYRAGLFILTMLLLLSVHQLALAQSEDSTHIQQIVTFQFLPGKSAEAHSIYRDSAVPLYEHNSSMLSFRAYREAESPIPLDLIVVSTFDSMAGMDESNRNLSKLAQAAGSSIGAIYGGIAALTVGHTDEFVKERVGLGNSDVDAQRLSVFIRYQIVPGGDLAFEDFLQKFVVPWEVENGYHTTTSAFIVSDGWDYLRTISIQSLDAFQLYVQGIAYLESFESFDQLIIRKQEIIAAEVPNLSVR